MPPYQSLAARQAQQQAAPQQQPALQTSTPGQQLTIPAAMAVLTRLHQQHQHHQQSTSTVAEAAAAAGAAAVAGMRLPSAGSKRARLCSATGSAGDATKHAASGGSSSSHQQLSADEELDEELDDDEGDDYAEATARCFSGKRSRSPRSFEQPADDEAAAAAAAEHMDDEEDVEKSQDELDAVQCLQQLAMSAGAGAGESQGANHTSVPSLVFDSLAHSNRFAAGPNRGAGGNLARWPSSGPTNATHGAAGAAAGYAGSSSSNGSGGNGGNSSTYNHVMQAQLLSYLGAINPEGFEGSHNPRAQQQGAQPVQQKRVSLPFGSAQQPQAAQQQQRQQHNFGGLTMQRSGSLGTSWGPAAKSPAPAAPSGSMGVVARARKQSWVSSAGCASCLQGRCVYVCLYAKCMQSSQHLERLALIASLQHRLVGPACKLLLHPTHPSPALAVLLPHSSRQRYLRRSPCPCSSRAPTSGRCSSACRWCALT
jgi:hypothetical protein